MEPLFRLANMSKSKTVYGEPGCGSEIATVLTDWLCLSIKSETHLIEITCPSFPPVSSLTVAETTPSSFGLPPPEKIAPPRQRLWAGSFLPIYPAARVRAHFHEIRSPESPTGVWLVSGYRGFPGPWDPWTAVRCVWRSWRSSRPHLWPVRPGRWPAIPFLPLIPPPRRPLAIPRPRAQQPAVRTTHCCITRSAV